MFIDGLRKAFWLCLSSFHTLLYMPLAISREIVPVQCKPSGQRAWLRREADRQQQIQEAWLAPHRLRSDDYSGKWALEAYGAWQRQGRCPEQQGHLVVVGGGSSKVYPRGGFPLWPKLTRKGTLWVLGFALAPPTKCT